MPQADGFPLAIFAFVGATVLSVFYISPTTFGTVVDMINDMKTKLAFLFDSTPIPSSRIYKAFLSLLITVPWAKELALVLLILSVLGFGYLGTQRFVDDTKIVHLDGLPRTSSAQSEVYEEASGHTNVSQAAGTWTQTRTVQQAFSTSHRRTQNNHNQAPLPSPEPTTSPEPNLLMKVHDSLITARMRLFSSSPTPQNDSPALISPTVHPEKFAKRLLSQPKTPVQTPLSFRSSTTSTTTNTSKTNTIFLDTGSESPFRKSLKTLKDTAPSSFLALQKAGLLNGDGTPTEKMEGDEKYRRLLGEEVRVVEVTTPSGKVVWVDDD